MNEVPQTTDAGLTGDGDLATWLGGASSTELSKVVTRVMRTLRFVLREDGTHLWRHRYVGATCRPVLQQALALDPPDVVREALEQASNRLAGLDGRRWSERQEPLQEVLGLLEPYDGASLRLEAPPRARLLTVPDEAPKAPAARKDQARAPRLRRLPLAHPDGTGKPVAELPGATPLVVAALEAAGVKTIAELLLRRPESVDELPLLGDDEPLEDGARIALRGTVRARYTRLGPAGRSAEVVLEHPAGKVVLAWADELPRDVRSCDAGSTLVVVGEVELEDGPVLHGPMTWRADSRGVVRVPRYGIEGADDEQLHRLVRSTLADLPQTLTDPLPALALKQGRVVDLPTALCDLHVPVSGPRSVRRRFAFEELVVHQLKLSAEQPARLRGMAHAVGHELVSQLQAQHALELDDAQEFCFSEIRRDLSRSLAMTRLLQGDVGSGKSIVALLSAVLVAQAKGQVLYLAPDKLAAGHRYLFAEPILRAAGLVPRLLDGALTKGHADALKRGTTQLVVDTHELLRQGLPEFRKLGLVIVEERDGFGVVDREKLVQKGVHPDLLVTTAVPIPTSLVFTLFSDYELSVIDTPSCQQVDTLVGGSEIRDEAYGRLRAHLDAGRQAYVVFPYLNGREIVDIAGANQLAAALSKEAFGGARVAAYHGSMSREERVRVFDDFQHRRIDVLLSTTVIEDAPEVANATAMLVEQADRFDLTRLHRLRGHVALGRAAGVCAMVLSGDPDAAGQQHIDTVASEQDGFAIAERDRLARGDEALLGARAAELPAFQWADPVRERALLLQARRVAFAIRKRDPQLRQQAHRELAAMVAGRPPESGQPPGEGRSGRRKRRRRRRS